MSYLFENLTALFGRVSQQAPSSASCCDSIKVHFFRVSKDNCDFMYSTSFPLRQAPTSNYRVFNYNDSDGQSCERDSSIRVIVANHTLPTSLMLLSPKGPDAAHHKRTIDVGNWIDVTFSEMWPNNKTCMTNPRTYFRDYCCTLFFTDICKLFDKSGRSNLPPWLACYSLANALIVNGVPPRDFLEMPIDKVRTVHLNTTKHNHILFLIGGVGVIGFILYVVFCRV